MPKKTSISKTSLQNRIKQVRKILKEEGSAAAVATYAVISTKQSRIEKQDICHARLKNVNGSILAVLDMHVKWKKCIEKKNHNTYKKVVKYVISDSIWKDAFLSNNHVNFLQHGVLLNVSAPNSYVAQAVMALRMPKERRARLPIFAEAKKAGVCDDVAYLTMLILQPEEVAVSFTAFLSPCTSHTPVYSYASYRHIISFMKGKSNPFRNEKSFNSDNSDWRINSKFMKEGSETFVDFGKKFLQKHKGNKKLTRGGIGWMDTPKLTKEGVRQFARELQAIYEEI